MMADKTLTTHPRNDNRAASTTLGYALTLAIAMLLVSGLLISTGGLVTQQRERTVQTELEVIGQRIAADVTAADRLVQSAGQSGSIGAVNVNREHPSTVSGSSYVVALRATKGGSVLTLSTDSPQVSVQIELANQTPVANSAVSGGSIQVSYADTDGDGQKDMLVLQND